MKELAKHYYKSGFNCCECIIMAAKSKYNLNITSNMLKFGSCINTGLGVGSICSSIVGGAMIIGYIFEKKIAPEHTELKHIRMNFINTVNTKIDFINCAQIMRIEAAKPNCLEVIGIIAQCLEDTIEEYLYN